MTSFLEELNKLKSEDDPRLDEPVFSDYAYCNNCSNYDKEKQYCIVNNEHTKPNKHCPSYLNNAPINTYKINSNNNNNNSKDIIRKEFFMVHSYMDNIKHFHSNQPFYYDKNGLFWFWNYDEYKWVLTDEVDIMISLEKTLGFFGQTLSSSVRSAYLEAFKRIGRMNIPKDAPKRWVQFKGQAYSLRSGMHHNITPDFKFHNPIPWELGKATDTPTIDKLFEEWVGKDYVETLYEVIAYCCYCDYPIQTIISLHGNGRNGKSQFLKLLTKFIGIQNMCSTELDRLTGTNSSRFESFKLYRKLVCQIGETNFNVLQNSSIIKKLTGGDMIDFEVKNKTPFNDYSYAKLIIASNSLPTSLDTSDGFYRRWVIIRFPNEFKEGKDIVNTIPDYEYNNLALKCCNILGKLLDKGSFKNQGTIEERKESYIMASNPLSHFIKNYCISDSDSFIGYNELYLKYVSFLRKIKQRKVSRKEFKFVLEDEGFFVERSQKKISENNYKTGYWIDGLRFCDNCDNCARFSTPHTYIGNQVGNSCKLSQFAQNEQNVNLINHKCTICQSSPCVGWDAKGKPICQDCQNAINIQDENIY